jgi:hypothetical protein
VKRRWWTILDRRGRVFVVATSPPMGGLYKTKKDAAEAAKEFAENVLGPTEAKETLPFKVARLSVEQVGVAAEIKVELPEDYQEHLWLS